MYYIGIDFGHGETTVSRAPGYNGAPVSQIAIRTANNNEGKKIVSAVCKKNGTWSLVYGPQDYRRDDIREGFKGRISKMTDRDKESMCEFAKLIFKTILENDTDLQYESVDNKNFELGIACPSDWVRQDPNAQQEYLDFFRNECGLPVDHCIKESDAAFFTKFDKYDQNDKVFVIDLGSSTIDFTTYAGAKCITSCCWGANLGAHLIEDALMPYILQSGMNTENIKTLKDFKTARGYLGDVESAISLFVRGEKENYYSSQQDEYSVCLKYDDLTPGWTGQKWDVCLGYSVSKEDFERIVSNYMNSIREVLNNAKAKLVQNGIVPNRVMLSGGASRMPFIKEYAKSIFNVTVDVDQQPECVVSNGIALYAQAFDKAFDTLLENMKHIDFENIYKRADTVATVEAIKELIPHVVSDIKNTNGCTGIQMRNMFLSFIRGLDANNKTYRELVQNRLNETLTTKAAEAIANAYKQTFNMKVSTTDIKISVQAQILSFAPQTLQVGGAWYNIFTSMIDDASGRFSFTWDIPRDSDERARIANGVESRLKSHISDPDFITYGNIDPIVQHIIKQVVYYTVTIFREKQLFETTFKQ